MLCTTRTAALLGIEAHAVELEVDLARQGMPAFTLVGLAEGAVREAKERVFSALKNSGYRMPPSRITVNMAPADLKKSGSAYDLPLALGLLGASGAMEAERLEGWLFSGELSLSGELKPIPGVLPLAVRARDDGARGILVPRANAAEAAVVEGLEVYGVETLAQAVEFLSGRESLEPAQSRAEEDFARRLRFSLDFAEVKGQEHAKRAVEIAAAGAHNLLFSGPPGSGKTMLAKRIPTVLPPLAFEEALEVTKIYSVAGMLAEDQSLVATRPFRSPHHTISDAGLIGGGAHPRPGEVSLGHRGVLFLDELPEFKKQVLEALRQPLEDGRVTISRAALSLTYPADFMLVAALNPCPCGYLTDERHGCSCTPNQVRAYQARVSGPLLDRIDLQVEAPAVEYHEMRGDGGGTDSATMRDSVLRARKVQAARFGQSGPLLNADLSGAALEAHCTLGDEEHRFMEGAFQRLGLSARASTRVLRLARTIADLEGADRITTPHLAEAISYRGLDRSRSG
ncbi:YifB family Mg chelatase-like AAA ATPase [Desulfohalovibrio reitneri]|uniref:YifB family Mg chelatase-like AAA ATPase n=1 Tax=Desulfohalovibrio reitneri TaxID=1307759 RepID=UPI0004A6C8E7|nr:YifB family Mg chelatase-like AAA ATPase [Desulfohalovibrio reitneri]